MLISPEDLAELEETLAVLGDARALADVREADQALGAGEVLRGVGDTRPACLSKQRRYDLAVTPPARPALAPELPDDVAAPVIKIVTGALLDRPRLVGKPLRGELTGSVGPAVDLQGALSSLRGVLRGRSPERAAPP